MRAERDAGDDDDVDAEDGDPPDLLRRALLEIGGLVGKERVSIDVISPLLLADDEDDDVGFLLAGEFMGDFGGFVSRDLRASDFALGYQSALAWLEDGLSACELDEGIVERTVSFVRSRRRYELDEVQRGDAQLGDLSLEDRWQLVRLGAHTARVLGSGASICARAFRTVSARRSLLGASGSRAGRTSARM